MNEYVMEPQKKRRRLHSTSETEIQSLFLNTLFDLQMKWNSHFNLFPRDNTALYDHAVNECKGSPAEMQKWMKRIQGYMESKEEEMTNPPIIDIQSTSEMDTGL